MPFFERNYQHGHLFIDFEIIFPNTVNEIQAASFSKVLPPAKNKTGDVDSTVEVYNMTEFKIEEENTHHGGGTKGSKNFFKKIPIIMSMKKKRNTIITDIDKPFLVIINNIRIKINLLRL